MRPAAFTSACALALALALVPAAAQALSCLPPNPARELDAAFRAGGDPRLLIGRLTTPFDNQNSSYRFEGRVFGRNVTINRLSSNVDVSATCIAEWCGELPRRPVEGLFISDNPGSGLKLVFDPCGSARYEMPTEAEIDQLRGCIEAEGCTPAAIEAFDR